MITVVIPTHNRPRLLAEALASVVCSPLIRDRAQIVVVDDDRADDGAERVAKDFGVRYAIVVCHGPSGTRNAGLSLAESEFVTFLDDDDLWLPGAHEAQLAALQADREVCFAYGRFRRVAWDLSELPNRVLKSSFLSYGIGN